MKAVNRRVWMDSGQSRSGLSRSKTGECPCSVLIVRTGIEMTEAAPNVAVTLRREMPTENEPHQPMSTQCRKILLKNPKADIVL